MFVSVAPGVLEEDTWRGEKLQNARANTSTPVVNVRRGFVFKGISFLGKLPSWGRDAPAGRLYFREGITILHGTRQCG